ncbi:hypothetical protein SAMN05421837_105278 [Amycolatopsis pretoriensis]|uniref:Uncharacterized protein n=1 Tax=Amycolatopsis pretoriensis TaxID=218821 RepID=A0A1H5QZ06_9PSEU|nr:hypothetical protein [Amycolatopsis pretoriensis]SEF30561.1 hypothetical protein SAMN05421837_105278 [Amycolatopsis pretoriensis]
MSDIRRISPTEWVVYRGERFPAEITLPDRAELRRKGAAAVTVPITELDEWYSIRTWGTFLEHEFEVVDERDGRYSLFMMSGDGKWAERVWAEPEAHPEVAFQRMDRMTFVAVAPKHMVTGFREVRSDILPSYVARLKETDES